MYKSILVIICTSLASFTLSSCVALGTYLPDECKDETPFTGVHDIFWKKPINQKKSTKAEFLNDWGRPDEIISSSGNKEIWIYKRHLWCGVMPIIILPIPFILPVCDGFDRIEFNDNEAVSLHTRSIVSSIYFLKPDKSEIGSACRFPLPPNNGVDSDAAESATQVTP